MSATNSDGRINYALYRYTPSIPAAVVFAGIFLLLSVLHLIRLIRNRTFFFIPFVVGLLCEHEDSQPIFNISHGLTPRALSVECAGYIARIFSHFDTTALGPYIVQTMLILVAPPLFAASIYMTLGRTITKLDAEDKSIVPVRFLTKIFVVGDVISFVLQCGGLWRSVLFPYLWVLIGNRRWLYGRWNIVCYESWCSYCDWWPGDSARILRILRLRVRFISLANEEMAAV